MKVRLCRESDVSFIMKLGKDVFRKERWYTRRFIERIVRDNPLTCWVIEHAGKIKGVRLVDDDSDGRAWGWLLVMDKGLRHRGVGSWFFRDTVKKLRRMGFRKLYAECSAKDKDAIDWHLKVGYRMQGVLHDWFGRGHDAIIFDFEL
jgi:GNAT superfamily N-acetyltransferase